MDHDTPNSETPDALESSTAQSLGVMLRTARESRDIAIEKIADELRIDAHVLEALEQDRLADIHMAPVFIKGYIKQYGRQLDLDYEDLKTAYQRQVEADDITLQPNRTITLRDERQITVWIIAVLVLLLVGVLLFVWVLLGEDDFTPAASIASNDTSSRVTSLAPSVPAATRALSNANRPAPAPELQNTEVTTSEPQVSTETLVIEEIAVPPPTATTAESAVATQPTSVPTSIPPGAVDLEIQFREASWLEVTDARSGRIYYDLGQAGQTMRFFPEPPANILVGNAEAVVLTVNGAPYQIPAQGRRGNVASFVLSAPRD